MMSKTCDIFPFVSVSAKYSCTDTSDEKNQFGKGCADFNTSPDFRKYIYVSTGLVMGILWVIKWAYCSYSW